MPLSSYPAGGRRLTAERVVSALVRTSHARRHSLATHLLPDGYDIRTIRKLLKHRDTSTTMVYAHVLARGERGVTSPLDR